ncbi:hypothetical protein ACJMK2_009510 [Sinanodonta woodiana]|uniref:15-hydroxyprostaglandin dehydrogenase [NAD(+)] n=1 Tax=Sinanodonta woodiana TaxID=1069815 RepID=A0ABD3VCH2_SINWO
MTLEGKVALVTGGAQGLGRAFSEKLLQNGAKVAIGDLNQKQGEQTIQELTSQYGIGRAIFVPCNVTSLDDMTNLFQNAKEAFGCLDIVVNNAGIGGEFAPMWEKVIDVNIKGVVHGTQLAIEYLRKDKGGNGGHIINMASAGGLNPNPFSPVYGATKAAVVHFTRCWAMNSTTIDNGIRLNILCPSFVDTPMTKNISETVCHNYETAKGFIEKIGVISPETVADALMTLLKNKERNGAILKVSKHGGEEFCTLQLVPV